VKYAPPQCLVVIPFIVAIPFLLGNEGGCESQREKERSAVDRQQAAYLAGQPIPTFDFSLERARIIQLYEARMNAAQTWSVWRSQTGVVEGDCPSSGYPLPYGVQLTSPEVYSQNGTTLPQAEPNGLFTNGITTNGTWVFCITDGAIAPVYVETYVSVFSYPVVVDYETNQVKRDGAATVTLKK
jgi:hypothetical protein